MKTEHTGVQIKKQNFSRDLLGFPTRSIPKDLMDFSDKYSQSVLTGLALDSLLSSWEGLRMAKKGAVPVTLTRSLCAV